MAEVPSDVRWPPGNSIDFDTILERALNLKELHFPEHTARDLADPYIQLLVLMSSMGQHAFGRMNYALLQLSPKTATSRQALLAFLEIVNRPLLPLTPSQGPIYARIKDPNVLVLGQTIVEANQRIAPTGSIDPIFSFDRARNAPTTFGFLPTFFNGTTEVESSMGPIGGPYSGIVMSPNDAVIFTFSELAFDGILLNLISGISLGDEEISWEFRNSEVGTPNNVANLGTTLRFTVNTYLSDGQGNISADPVGLFVRVTHKPTDITETVQVFVIADVFYVDTSFLGQSSPSLSSNDYEIFAEWRPIQGITDPTDGLRITGEDLVVSWPIDQIFDTTARWARTGDGSFQVRARKVQTGSTAFADPVQFSKVDFASSDMDLYVVGSISQGFRRQLTIGNADGTEFQFLPAQNDPIFEPINEPAVRLIVGTDEDWEIVEDFSESGSDSKHAIFREDPDQGWGVLFGDGTIGFKPPQGDAIKITIRTDSSQPGDLSPLSEIRAIGGLNLVDRWTIFDGTEGYAPPEASDRQSALRFRANILPQLALRAESVVSAPEIITALTTVTPNRASFTTSDGRSPFSRAFFTTEGAGDRQYRIIVVGPETDDVGEVLVADLEEAEIWLNGEDVGTRRVGGRGVNNTEAILTAFIPKELVPTITITVPNPSGIRDQIDQIVTNFFKPHSRDDNEEFRWDFGGTVPVALLFGLVWNAVPSRSNLDVTISDGVLTFDAGDQINLITFELPTLASAYDKNVNIIIIEE